MRLTVLAASIFLSAAMVMSVSGAFAQSAGAAAPAPSVADLEAIAPVINEQTALVARVALTPRNVDALLVYAHKAMDPLQSDEDRAAHRPSPLDELKAKHDEFVAAGGRDLYLVINGLDAPPLTVITLTAGADIKALCKLFSAKDAAAPDDPAGPAFEVGRKIGSVLVITRPGRLAQIEKQPPAPRPELARAMAAIGSAAVQVVALSTPAVREKLTATTLPAEMGGGSAEAVAKNMRWAALGVSPLPELTLDLTVQAGDARGAKGIHAMFLQVIEALGKPASAPAKEPAPGRIMLSMLALAPELVQPQIKGDQVFFHLGPKEMDRVVAELTPVLRKDRQAASARNVRAMLKGCIMYCANNNDQWPPDLDALVKDGLAPRMLTNPCRPSAKPGYIYVKPKAGADGNPVVIYEAYGQWPGSIAVGLADGHAKVVKSEQEFKDLLAGKAPASASPPGGQP